MTSIHKKDFSLVISIIFAVLMIGLAWVYDKGSEARKNTENIPPVFVESGGVVLPIRWGEVGKNLVETGVLDKDAFVNLYASRGGVPAYELSLIENGGHSEIVMNNENAGMLLNLLWGVGLGTKSKVLDEGPMMDPRYGGPENFASTAGWTLARGNTMDHYSAHELVRLTENQEMLVERVAKNIFRPCCGNATHFPDCNHGMAMLGLLELMAANNVSEEEMYRVALQVNEMWFPDTYAAIKKYVAQEGILWDTIDPKTVLGASYSSATGYQRIKNLLRSTPQRSGGGCGV